MWLSNPVQLISLKSTNETSQQTSMQGDNQFVLQAITGNKWEVVKNKNNIFITAQKAFFANIKDFVQSINNIYVENFIDVPINLDDFKTTNIIITTKEIEKNITFYTKNDITYLKIEGEPTLFQLALIDKALLNKTFEDFQNKRLWKWHSDEKLIDLQLIDENKIPVKINISNLNTKVLSNLEVKQWIIDDISYPLFNAHSWTLKMETVDNQQVHRIYTLKFNDRISGSIQSGQYLSEKFLFNQDWIDILFQLIHKPFWDKMSNYFPLKQ